MADKKGKSSTVKASASNSVSRSSAGDVTTVVSAAERAANAQGKTLIEVAPLTSDGSGKGSAKASSTLPAGKSLNEVNQAQTDKLAKSASSRKGLEVGETVFSKKAAAPKAAAKKAAPKKAAAKKEVKAEAKEVKEVKAVGVDPLADGREA